MLEQLVGGTEQTTSRLFADRLRLTIHFDPQRLAAALRSVAGAEWIAHFVRQNYRGEWSILPLRAPKGAVHPILRAVSNPGAEWEDTELLDVAPYFRAVLGTFRCPLESARLMRLGPGSAILEHRDPDLDPDGGVIRLHVPVLTNDDVDFRLSNRRVTMAPGSVWYLRLSDPHRVSNGGTSDRVHLVIDARVNEWLLAQLGAAVENDG